MVPSKAIEPRPVAWRMLSVGAKVWAPYGDGWIAGTVLKLGRNRGQLTVCTVAINAGRTAKYCAHELYWRHEQHDGADKPAPRCRLDATTD